MVHRRLLFPLLGLLAWAFAGAAHAAEPYAVGDRIDPFTLEDQYGASHTVDDTASVILFSRDMGGGDFLKRALADAPEGFLAEHGAVYVADISGMPSIIARLFAVPSMRRRGYPMLLDRDGATTARLPDVPGKATLLFLEEGALVRVLHADSPDAVRRAVGLAPGGSDAGS